MMQHAERWHPEGTMAPLPTELPPEVRPRPPQPQLQTMSSKESHSIRRESFVDSHEPAVLQL